MTDRPSLYDTDADPNIWSNVAQDGQRLTWLELAEERLDRLDRLEALQRLVRDLDRCIHGRHQTDPCSYCQVVGGTNLGNLFAARNPRIGTDLGGNAITINQLLEAAQ